MARALPHKVVLLQSHQVPAPPLDMQLDGSAQRAGEGAFSWRVGWEGVEVVSRAEIKGKPCVIRRSCEGDRVMVVKVLYDNFYASRTYKRCDTSGELIDYYDID